jgi:hypothetical protein
MDSWFSLGIQRMAALASCSELNTQARLISTVQANSCFPHRSKSASGSRNVQPSARLYRAAPMLNDTTKRGEVLQKGGLDLVTLLNRRGVELHAHLTVWCGNDDQQRCEQLDHLH